MLTSLSTNACRFARSSRGAAVVEAAIVLPFLILLLFGLLRCAWYLFLSHAVQQSANEAARATLAGLSPQERSTIANQVASDAFSVSGVASSGVTVATAEDGQTLTVIVGYDASTNALIMMPFAPTLPSVIQRSAAVRLADL